jgi:outer membrane protein TolC
MKVGIALLLSLIAFPVAGQDTLRLPAMLNAAAAADARSTQRLLQDQALEIRLRNLRAERLPQLSVRGEGTIQSGVPTLPFSLPGLATPEPPRERFQAAFGADQLLYDGGQLSGRERVEQARRVEAAAELEVALFALATEVNSAFFETLLLQEREAEIRLHISDLESRLAEVRSQHREGAALAGDTAAIQAERLRAYQSLDEIQFSRAALLEVLGALTNQPITEADVLELPDLAWQVDAAEAAGGAAALRARPEFARFATLRARVDREADLLQARERPRLRAIGQAGIGRPGPFELFSEEVHEFWSVGLWLDWQPWSRGMTDREVELLQVQRAIANTEEAAFAARLERQVVADLQAMDRLRTALDTDDRITVLREQVELQARRQFEERTITPAQYLAARTNLLESRLARQRHRIDLEHARARYLTTIGELPR